MDLGRLPHSTEGEDENEILPVLPNSSSSTTLFLFTVLYVDLNLIGMSVVRMRTSTSVALLSSTVRGQPNVVNRREEAVVEWCAKVNASSHTSIIVAVGSG